MVQVQRAAKERGPKGSHCGYTGIMEKKMETTTMGSYRV